MRLVLYTFLFILTSSCANNDEIISLVKVDGKFGFVDRNGNWFINPRTDSLGSFYNGFANSYRNEKEGIIDSKGVIIIDHKYDFIGHFEDGLALVINNDSINYIDLDGNLISDTMFFDGERYSCGIAPVQFVKDGKWGYIDVKGRLIIEAVYDYAHEFEDCFGNVDLGEFSFRIDKNGSIVDTIEYEVRRRKFRLIGNSDNKSLGMLNSRGDTIMKSKYKSFGYRQGNKFWFYDGLSYGLADTTGRILTNKKYDYLSSFSDNGLALVKLNGKYGFIDKNLVQVINFQFEEAQGFKHGLAAVKIDNKWGFINDKGNIIIEAKFDKVLHQFRSIKSKFEPMYSVEDDRYYRD